MCHFVSICLFLPIFLFLSFSSPLHTISLSYFYFSVCVKIRNVFLCLSICLFVFYLFHQQSPNHVTFWLALENIPLNIYQSTFLIRLTWQSFTTNLVIPIIAETYVCHSLFSFIVLSFCVYLSLSFSLSISISLSVLLCINLFLFISLSVFLCIYLFLCI